MLVLNMVVPEFGSDDGFFNSFGLKMFSNVLFRVDSLLFGISTLLFSTLSCTILSLCVTDRGIKCWALGIQVRYCNIDVVCIAMPSCVLFSLPSNAQLSSV